MADSPGSSFESRVEFYQQRVEQFDRQIQRWSGPLGGLFVARGLFLLVFLIACVFTLATLQWWAAAIALLALPAFVWTAFRHENYDRLRKIASIRRQNDVHSIARLKRKWDELPVIKTSLPDAVASLAKDLDLFGKASVFQWLCVARTPMGCDTLRDWILNPATPSEVGMRQSGVEDLRDQRDYLDDLQLKAQVLSASRNGPRQFVSWAEGPRWLEQRTWLIVAARILTVGVLGLLFALGLGLIDKTIGGVSLVALLAINFGLTLWFAGRIHDIFNSVAAKQVDVAHYRRLFEHAGEVPGSSLFIESIREGLREGRRPAIDSISELGLVMAMANLRRAGLFGLVYLMLQFFFLWDLHWLAVLENWHRKHGAHVRGWFAALGRLEALMCLAKLAQDQPDWKFPSVVELAPTEAMVTAEDMGHPLLSDLARVRNSVSVGPPGTVLLVTGSNMSGKSTLLRALGVNLVLAQAGSVVCARQLTLPPLELATSMRIHDSLADGVSFYMAELKRLKEVVDQARQRQSTRGPRLFFLLDEILQGTNSRERHVAVSRVVHHLVESGAIGAVSTHDLELVDAPGLAGQCTPVHFRESFEESDGKSQMVFDYQMRPGIATTTNALKLLQLVGLDDGPLNDSQTTLDTSSDTNEP